MIIVPVCDSGCVSWKRMMRQRKQGTVSGPWELVEF